jgi:hypothetical protein
MEEIKITANANALSLLKKIMEERNWYDGKMDRRIAATMKINLDKGKVSYAKACEVLSLLGWEKSMEETWQK